MALARCYPVLFLRKTLISLRLLVNGFLLGSHLFRSRQLTIAQTITSGVVEARPLPTHTPPTTAQMQAEANAAEDHGAENIGPHLEPAFLQYSVQKGCVFFCLSQCEPVFSFIAKSILPDIGAF